MNGIEGVIVEQTSFSIPKHEDKFALGTLCMKLTAVVTIQCDPCESFEAMSQGNQRKESNSYQRITS